MAEDARKKLDELIDDFDTAMLVTQSLEGRLRGRPMAIAEHARGGALYFATRSEDEKLEEILKKPDVTVTMQREGCYLSISGKARIETDLKLAEKVWSASMRLWFPEGAGDPHLSVILVEPEYAEYWDRRGAKTLEFLWEAGRALIRGRKASGDELGEHDKLKLGT